MDKKTILLQPDKEAEPGEKIFQGYLEPISRVVERPDRLVPFKNLLDQRILGHESERALIFAYNVFARFFS